MSTANDVDTHSLPDDLERVCASCLGPCNTKKANMGVILCQSISSGTWILAAYKTPSWLDLCLNEQMRVHACLQCVGTQSISHALHACMACRMCEGGISEENGQGKRIWSLWMECAGLFQNMGFASGVTYHQCNCWNVKACQSRPIPFIWMEPAMPTHFRVWMLCFCFMKSAPKAMDCRLAPHPRESEQTCKMKAHAWRRSQQTFTSGLSDSWITCLRVMYVLGAAHSPLSASTSNLVRRKHLLIRLSLKKTNSGLGSGWDLGLMQVMERWVWGFSAQLGCETQHFLLSWA